MPESQRGEVVVITGAGAGLGRAIARAFARRGAQIGLLSRGEERLEDARREVESLGGTAVCLPTDVADADAVEAAARGAEEALGPIDIWVNNAMTTVFSPVREMQADEYRRVTEVTYLGYVYGTQAALRRMLPRDRGTIVQVGSALAYRSIPLQSAYCGAKHAIVGFTDSLRSELLHDGSNVWVTGVHMPALNTPQFSWCKSRMPRTPQPVPPIFQPDVGAEAVYWAAHRREREVFVGWPTTQAIWGQRFIPGLLDRFLARRAWDGQMTDVPDQHDRPDGLYQPVAGHQAAEGTFGGQAKPSGPPPWLTTHAGALAGVAGAALLGMAAAALRRR
jgi:NAD(P)-dependent dehydrogenase (short-subunit alcohol dehydrogenase family)